MSVRGLTDETGAITDTFVFDAFGNEVARTGNTDNSYGFQGEEKDATGLYYLRARYMDPSTGTFTSMDTYAGSLSDPMSLHKYLFANSNPVKYCDPSGHYTLAEEMEVCNIMCVLSAVSYSYFWALDCEATDPSCKEHSLSGYLIGLLVSICFGMLMGMFIFTPVLGIVLGAFMVLYSIPGFIKAYEDIKRGYLLYGIFEALLALIGVLAGIRVFATGIGSLSGGMGLGGGSNDNTDVSDTEIVSDNNIPFDPSDIIIDDQQFGKKYGKHGVCDYGFSGQQGTNDYLTIIQESITNPTEVRRGSWSGQGDCYFYIHNSDVTIVRTDGTWVSTFPLTEQGTIGYITSLPIVYP